MYWLLGISLLLNLLFIGYLFFIRIFLRRKVKQLQEIIAGESKMPLKISGYSKPHDKFVMEINRLVDRLTELSIQFERVIDENKRMVSSISHDFRTPLTSMLGYIQILKKEAYTSNEEKYLGIIEERTRSLNHLVDEFYTLSLLESDEYNVSFQKVNPILLIQEELALYYDELDKAFDQVEIDMEEIPLSIQTSPTDVKRVVGNLIKNAFQHGTGTFKLQSIKEENRIFFRFENQVLDPEKVEMERLFDRLYRGDKSRKSGSSGLGLSIAKKLAERLRMTLEAELKDNQLTFILIIPIEEWDIQK